MKNKLGIFLKFKTGQAAVELAIFGSIILLAFSVLLMYGQRLESQQHVKMEAFRRALQKAYERNGSVSYTLKKEGRSFNLFGGFGQGQSSTVAATASVLWQKGMPGAQDNEASESYSYYAINDNELELSRYPKQQKNLMGKDVTVYVPASVYNEEQARLEQFAANTRKQESPAGGIANTRTSDLSDTINTTLHVRVDTSYDSDPHDSEVPLPVYVYEGQSYNDTDMGPQTIQTVSPVSVGAYARDDINRIDYSKDKVDTTIHRERTWQTNN
jgi:hypothetical protein